MSEGSGNLTRGITLGDIHKVLVTLQARGASVAAIRWVLEHQCVEPEGREHEELQALRAKREWLKGYGAGVAAASAIVRDWNMHTGKGALQRALERQADLTTYAAGDDEPPEGPRRHPFGCTRDCVLDAPHPGEDCLPAAPDGKIT